MSMISLHCGLRQGEIFNLKVQDIDIQNGMISILDSKNKSRRTAYMTFQIKELLQPYCTGKPNDLLFTDNIHDGRIKYLSKTFTRIVDKLKLNAGVTDTRQKITFHSLRHTFASWLALQGESLITLRDLLGHKTTTMTNRYAHLSGDHKKAAVQKLENTIREQNGHRIEMGSI
jgi:integrase